VTVRQKRGRKRREDGRKRKKRKEYPDFYLSFFTISSRESRILILKKKQYRKYQIYPNR
jgi:hypothetical protein